ncbi:hypothetical protein Ddc_22197 [Ditylenchus destructor]|nr:hypothetical protein Ddc_22197 [Ditylenchus destructor]
MDNGTMVNAFKFLNYMQLAKTSLVSKRFSNLIRTHRHTLALLYVYDINMYRIPFSAFVRGETNIELNHENLDRLLTDPFIYIRHFELHDNDVILNLLAAQIGPNRRIRCKQIDFISNENIQNFMKYINNRVSCDELIVEGYIYPSHRQYLLDIFVTGAQCTSSIIAYHNEWCNDLSEIYIGFVQKFMDHKKCDEFQFVESIKSNLIVEGHVIDELELLYLNCIVEEINDDDGTTYVLEFNNNDIGKKLQLTVFRHTNYEPCDYRHCMEIKDL